MENYTLTYSESVNGWPSFYSYFPEIALGMNQYLYSFKGGNLYRHNTNGLRNNYYGVSYESTITSVFNQMPTTSKVFKTIELESDDSWNCVLVADLGAGYLPGSYFIEKEGAFFAFIRRLEGVGNLALRSAQGVGTLSSTTGVGPAAITITFDFTINSIMSIGDVAFTNSIIGPVEIGAITGISQDRKTITIAAPTYIGTVPVSYILYVKNSVAESYGTLGYFLQFKLSNSNPSAVELFTVDSDVFKSNP